MQLTQTLSLSTTNLNIWLAQHPGLIRIGLVALPALLALGLALLTGNLAHACTPTSSDGCGG